MSLGCFASFVRLGLQLSTGMRDEVKDHNAILERVANSMGGAGDMLKGSMTKFNKVSSPPISLYARASQRVNIF